MDIKQFEKIIIEPQKIFDYLLNANHPDGSSKARFFTGYGFNENNLSDFLIRHLKSGELKDTIKTSFGLKYIIEGKLDTPNAQIVKIRAIWFLEKNQKSLKFVTAYPI